MRSLRALVLAGVLLASASSVYAQQSVDYASISGRVTDPSGAVVEGASVAARNTKTGVTATTATGRDGRFRFPYLRVGSYELVVGKPGFRDATHLLSLTVGAAFELPVSLTVGAVDTNVTVTGETTVLEAARSQIAGTVPQAEVQSVPLNGRNFLELALLVPGVSPTNVGSTQLFPETSAVPGISLSINSQRNLSNNFIVDGLSANDDAAGLSGITYGVDALEQVQVVTSGGQAELGRALGGHINIVTRSGTNTLHGTVYDYLRDDRFNARNPLSGTTLPMDQSQYGGSLGGPVVQGRTFYFANVEQRRLDQTGLTTITPANASIVNARLIATGYQAPLVTSGAYANPVDSTNVLAKLDHNVRDGHMFGIRYSLYDVGSENSRGAGGLNAPSASSALDNLDQTVALSHMLAAFAAHLSRNPRASCVQRLEGAAHRPAGPGRDHRGRGGVREALDQSHGPREHDVPGRQQPVASGGGARAEGRRGFSVQRRPDHVPSRGARDVRLLVDADLPVGRLQQRGLHADVWRHRGVADQSQPRRLRRRTSGKSALD